MLGTNIVRALVLNAPVLHELLTTSLDALRIVCTVVTISPDNQATSSYDREDMRPAKHNRREQSMSLSRGYSLVNTDTAFSLNQREGGGGISTFSSVPSKSFRRNDSTQSLKHFSTSELYIRKLQIQYACQWLR